MQLLPGMCARRGYAIGPAFHFVGRQSLAAAHALRTPAIIVASYIDERLLRLLDLTRVYGFILEHGSVLDPVFEVMEDIARPSLVGVRGILQAAPDGTTVVVDGLRNVAVIDPDPDARAHYDRVRGTRVPAEDPVAKELARRLILQIRHQKLLRKAATPYDLPSQSRLLDLARRLAKGGLPDAEDEKYVRALLERDDVE